MSWKQQGQLGRTTFYSVRANSPAHRRNAERKRGVSVFVRGFNINHGQSRTVLTNARLKFGRSCFYSCSSCCQLESGKRNLSYVLGCIGVEQKINGIDLLAHFLELVLGIADTCYQTVFYLRHGSFLFY